MDIGRKGIILVLLILVLPTSSAGLPTVSCAGCVRSADYFTDGTNLRQTFYAKEGSWITLEGDSGFWENANGQKIGSGDLLSFPVGRNGFYVLNTTDGDFYATINMIPLSPELPKKISDIYVDGNKVENHGKIETAQGSSLKLKVVVAKGDCPDYFVEWTSDSSAITFSDPYLLSTIAYIGDYSGKNPMITVTVYSENRRAQKTRDIELRIFKNTPPKIEIDWEPNLVESHEAFIVYFDGSTSGTSGDESDDYIGKVSASLQYPSGAITTRSKTMDADDSLKSLRFTAGERGRHYLTATVTDSYGATNTTATDFLVTEKGDSGKDKPLFHVREPVDCIADENCTIEIYGADKGIFPEYFYQGRELRKPFKFPAGDHRVEITAFEVDDKGRRKNEVKKTVWVHAVANDSNGYDAVAEPVSAPIPQEEIVAESQETPIGRMSIIALPIAAWASRRRRSKS